MDYGGNDRWQDVALGAAQALRSPRRLAVALGLVVLGAALIVRAQREPEPLARAERRENQPAGGGAGSDLLQQVLQGRGDAQTPRRGVSHGPTDPPTYRPTDPPSHVPTDPLAGTNREYGMWNGEWGMNPKSPDPIDPAVQPIPVTMTVGQGSVMRVGGPEAQRPRGAQSHGPTDPPTGTNTEYGMRNAEWGMNPKSKIENPKSPDPPIQQVGYQQESLPPEPPPQPPPRAGGPLFEQIGASGELVVTVRRNVMLKAAADVFRTAVVDPQICDVAQFSPREISIMGKGEGATHVTFWFAAHSGLAPVTYLVHVAADPEERRRHEAQYALLEEVLAELFRDSKVRLIPAADKLIVQGQAKDSEEAAQIMAIVQGRMEDQNFSGNRAWATLGGGAAARVLAEQETGRVGAPEIQVINMLRVPGVQQVALRVKIAELNRSAARGFGIDIPDTRIDLGERTSALFLDSMLNAVDGGATSLLAQFDGDDINLGIRYLQQHGVLRLLSEPTLVTMSGQPATFVAGGEFAVPTVVGTAGLNAVTTDFRSFGVIVSFLPVVVDKDRIRLQVAPEFSQINDDLTVDNTPGLNVRAVTTTVEMREGQTLAIAGLLDDSLEASKVGDLPILSTIFGRRDVAHNETELVILVTPELVHPLEPEEVPPLPGFDVTEPTGGEFFLRGRLEGEPTREYRSTVWPRLQNRYRSGGSAMISGPFGHGR